MHATLLLHLCDAQKHAGGDAVAWVSPAQLAELCGVDAAQVDTKMAYWTSQALVLQDTQTGHYACAAYRAKGGAVTAQDDTDTLAGAMEEENAETAEMIRSFVLGYLHNCGPAEPGAIENTLKLYMQDFAVTRAGLVSLLSGMVTAGELVAKGPLYALPS
eukprot:TRINITY_DN39829_c0_g1_i1.p1 TRINITY_DN39829_c0_g1~~TRINITY_DN39829_c0_g1_i1.p1  ORF type:complete len:167 (+),score=63.24 TRINITY_DN39829_c0_g1_i1:22-501(+)